MDLLSFFRSSPEKQIQKARKRVKEPHGDPAVRMSAAHKLREMGTREAILALLDRFTISVSPSSQDEEEKSEVLSWLMDMGDRAVEPLVRFLKRERQVYWAVQALKRILSKEEFAAKMNEILLYQWENPPASSDPKVQLIRLLDVRSPDLRSTVTRFLEDESDDVRLSALEYLFQEQEDAARDAILQCYVDSEDRPRVRNSILEHLAEAGWSVRGYRPSVEETLPEGYSLTRDGKVKVMGKL